jgi:hypothetical protein
MQVAWKPAPGQVALIEVDGDDRECLTGVVLDGQGTPVVVDLGSSPHLPSEDCEVVASFFAPDALYRMHATAHTHGDHQAVIDLRIHEIERVQRRSVPRVPLAAPVVLSNFDSPGDMVSVLGETIDIGLGGCRVRTAKPFPAGCDPTLSLQLPQGDALVVLAAVLQVNIIDGLFEYRLVFLSVDDDDQARLNALVTVAAD